MQAIAGSISVGRVARQHTLGLNGIRELSRNVDPTLTRDNIILVDELHGRSIEQYTNETFQPAIDEYNAKQKRKDRQIKTDYVEWHKNNGNLTQGKLSLAYECVVQIGDHSSIGRQYYEASGETRKKRGKWFERQYRGLLKDFQERFPHLKVLYAAIHFDEKDGTPHMHICFQPQAECQRGLSMQVSIGKALAEDGIKRAETRLEAQKEGFQMARMYREFHHDFINKRIREAGLEVKEEVHGRKHDDKSYFKDMMKELDQREEEFSAKKQAAKKEASEALTMLREKKQEADQAVAYAREQTAAAQKQKAEAQNIIAAANEREADANEHLDAVRNTSRLIDKEIERKQDKSKELDKRIEYKESTAQINDEINEIFRGSYGVPYPHIYSRGTKGWGKDQVKVVTIKEDDLHELRNKAACYETVTKKTRDLEKLGERVREDANKDQTIQTLKEQVKGLQMELQKARIERNQAQSKERDMRYRAERAENFIDSRDMANDYLSDLDLDIGHSHHIRH